MTVEADDGAPVRLGAMTVLTLGEPDLFPWLPAVVVLFFGGPAPDDGD